jgi:hypothetical protein
LNAGTVYRCLAIGWYLQAHFIAIVLSNDSYCTDNWPVACWCNKANFCIDWSDGTLHSPIIEMETSVRGRWKKIKRNLASSISRWRHPEGLKSATVVPIFKLQAVWEGFQALFIKISSPFAPQISLSINGTRERDISSGESLHASYVAPTWPVFWGNLQ